MGVGVEAPSDTITGPGEDTGADPATVEEPEGGVDVDDTIRGRLVLDEASVSAEMRF